MSNLQTYQSYYEESREFLYPRKLRQVKQLVLFNNLQRPDETISSSLLITLFNRIMSNLYDDKMQVKFVPSEEIEQTKINKLNLLAQNDYREMDKPKIDYDWTWDALAFGRGYCETMKFNKQRKIMEPVVINPLAFGYDPYFADKKQWRYYWKWVYKSKYELETLIKSGVITGISMPTSISSGVDNELWDYKVKLDAAKNAQTLPTNSRQSDIYQILEMFCYDENGKKCLKWIDKNFTVELLSEELKGHQQDDWPIAIKESFRMPHYSVPISILDLLDDKHRARSVLLNLALLAAKDEANPIYWYDNEKVKDITAFFSREINQHISVSGNGTEAFGRANMGASVSQSLLSFMQVLNQEANDPVGTGMALSPVKKGKASATETAIQQQLNDLAQSLQSKVLQMGEKDFWSDWYHNYADNAQSGDTKLATIVGVKGLTFETIQLEDIKTKYPPGVAIFSAKEAEYKELVLRRDFMQMYPQFAKNLDSEGMRNFNKHVFFPKFLDDPSVIELLVPKTLDEMKAEDENTQLEKDILSTVSETDEHTTHLYTHQMAKKTWATWFHIHWHQELLAMKKKQELDQQKQQIQNQQMKDGNSQDKSKGAEVGGADKPKIGEKKKNPQNAASPLQMEAQPKQVAQK